MRQDACIWPSRQPMICTFEGLKKWRHGCPTAAAENWACACAATTNQIGEKKHVANLGFHGDRLH
jgi:hypothetical protein